MDVVVGMVSFIPTFFLMQGVSGPYFILGFSLVLALNVILATVGWLASRKAEEFEQKLRSEFMVQRERLKERRARIRTAMKRRRAPMEE